MLPTAKIVIGSNFGDEGKGLITHLICQKAASENKKVLNILYNGGCQRGHTVDYTGGWRHVYHHFGSGSETLADTLIDSEFIINPTFFIDELMALHTELGFTPKVYIDPWCRVATPFDAILNQLVEAGRGDKRHGSCGFGIYETIYRYFHSTYNLMLKDLMELNNEQLFNYLDSIAKNYLINRIEEYESSGLSITVPSETRATILNQNLIWAYINDFRNMLKYIEVLSLDHVYTNYDMLVFEGAQGLSLDQDNKKYSPHLTPSNTTSDLPTRLCHRLGITNIETCYVTRSYFTRHGSGPFPTECDVAEINSDIVDNTNLPNPFQKTLRFGKFDVDEILSNIRHDKTFHSPQDKSTLFVTHCNYYDLDLQSENMKEFVAEFDDIYKIYDKCGEIIVNGTNKIR